MTYPINNVAMDGDEYTLHPGTLVVCMDGRYLTLGEIVKELTERRESLALAQTANEEQATLLTVAQFKAEQYRKMFYEVKEQRDSLHNMYNEIVEQQIRVLDEQRLLMGHVAGTWEQTPQVPRPVRRSRRVRKPVSRYTAVEHAYWQPY